MSRFPIYWRYPSEKIGILTTSRWFTPLRRVLGIPFGNWFLGLLVFDQRRYIPPALLDLADETEALRAQAAVLKDALAWTNAALEETLPIVREGAASGMVPLEESKRVFALVQRTIEINSK